PEGRRISFSTVPELADERTAHLASMDVTITKDTKKLETMHATQKRAEFERVRGALTNTMISRGSLVFFFDNGQGRLLMNGRELTNGFGLFTSFLIDRGWSSSRDAVWSTIRPRNDTLIAKGRFLNIPMQMIIIYKISDYNRLEASIAVEFFEDLSIQQMFTSLAVDNAYEEQGLRKMTFKTRKDYLPRIISFRNTDGILCTARAINEEYFAPAKGDVLSYKAIADKVLTKGMHDNFFKGEIDVDMIEPTNRR
ncbi:MAG: hypothetical protein JW938_02440, partial [Candidatus Omnitrophica bacterium]|nr:hypothetical protein [Candidatus Omnitrophota bacterium]